MDSFFGDVPSGSSLVPVWFQSGSSLVPPVVTLVVPLSLDF